MKGTSRYFTFILIPGTATGHSKTVKIHKGWMVLFAGFVLSAFIALSSILFFSSKYAMIMVNYEKSIITNHGNVKKLEKLQDESKKIRLSLLELKERDQELRRMLGLNDNYRYISLEKKAQRNFVSMESQNDPFTYLKNWLSTIYNDYRDMIQSQKFSNNYLQHYVHYLVQQFNFTPSTWPVSGYISSGFGMRVNPLTSRPEFHQGIDIPSWTGAPFKATAAGEVIASTWADGYGNMVVVDHHNGYQTFYAHNSKNLVRTGEWIQKGQPIGLIGSTGFATGPHLHYEVHKNKALANPTNYLKLTIFSLSKKLRG